MKTIDITTILGSELKSRTSARDFAKYLQNMEIREARVDFSHVKSVTRSFMDEFYNLFLKDAKVNAFSVKIVNVPEDIKAILDAVSRTQVRTSTIPSDTPEVKFKSVNDMLQFLSGVAL